MCLLHRQLLLLHSLLVMECTMINLRMVQQYLLLELQRLLILL